MRQVYQDDWLEEPLQDNFNYGIRANTIDAFSGGLAGSCQNPLTVNSGGNEVSINAFDVYSSTSNPYSEVLTEDYSPLASEVDAFSSLPLGSDFVENVPEFDSIGDSFGVSPSLDLCFSGSDGSPLDSNSSEYSPESSDITNTAPDFEEEFEIEIEELENIPKSEQEDFKRAVGQAVESGVATAATSILSAYVSPAVATIVVNTGITAGKKVCFGIANRRAQKKAVSDWEDSGTVTIASDSKKFSELKEKLKEKGKKLRKEVGKEVTRQICFGIENHRKQKMSGNASANSASKTAKIFKDHSLDYEPSDGVELEELLDSVDVAELVRFASNGLRKKIPTR